MAGAVAERRPRLAVSEHHGLPDPAFQRHDQRTRGCRFGLAVAVVLRTRGAGYGGAVRPWTCPAGASRVGTAGSRPIRPS